MIIIQSVLLSGKSRTDRYSLGGEKMSEAFIVIILLITSATAIISAIVAGLSLRQSSRTHILINSRMDELIRLTREAARKEGIAEEKERASHDTLVN